MVTETRMLESRKSITYYHVESNALESLNGSTIVEIPVSLTVNGEPWLTFMCTPVSLEALAVGFLFNEGVIDSMQEVADVRVCEHGGNVDVWLQHPVEKPVNWRRTSGCSGGVTAVDSIQRPHPVTASFHFKLPFGKIVEIAAKLTESQDLYRVTGGVHTSALADGENILLSADDIGRHNTLDKIAGMCLMQNIHPQNRILLTTGRISSEMLQKAARLGAGMLISRTSPSSLSIELAEKWDITIIGYARRTGFNVYTHPKRVSDIYQESAGSTQS